MTSGGTPDPEAIDLCLSGGGFRATLFHLGVLAALRDSGRLPSIRRLYSVSGGSILAAHAVLNWDEYLTPEGFLRHAKVIVRFARLDVRGRIQRRLFPFDLLSGFAFHLGERAAALLRLVGPGHAIRGCWKARRGTALLEAHYERLFNDSVLTALGGRCWPELRILATDLNARAICWFGSTGLHLAPGYGEPVGAGLLPVAFAVAASSAFPGFFPPAILDPWEVDGARPEGALLLTDGGVYDNFGLIAIEEPAGNGPPARVVVSDATSHPEPASNKRSTSQLFNAVRAVDIMQDRIAQLQRHNAEKHGARFIRISGTGPHPHLLAHLRTDLNRFSWTEIRCLIAHGYRAAADALKLPMPSRSFLDEPWLNLAAEEKTPARRRRAQGRLEMGRYRPFGFWSWRDPVSWLLLLSLLLVVAARGIVLFRGGPIEGLAESFSGAWDLPALRETARRWRRPPPPPLPSLHLKSDPVSPPGIETVEMEELTSPTYEGFIIERDARTWDLRKIVSIDEGEVKVSRKSPATLHRRVWVARRPSAGDKKEFVVQFRTSGLAIDFRAADGPQPVQIRHATMHDNKHQRFDEVYHLVYSVEGLDRFVLNVVAVYWNGFVRPGDWDVGLEVFDVRPEGYAVTMLFPPDRFPRSVLRTVHNRLTDITSDCEADPACATSFLRPLQDPADGYLNSILTWRISRPTADRVYWLRWDW